MFAKGQSSALCLLPRQLTLNWLTLIMFNLTTILKQLKQICKSWARWSKKVSVEHVAYFEKEAKWDNYLLVVMVTGRLEKVLMFVGFVCKSVWIWLLLRCTRTSRKGSDWCKETGYSWVQLSSLYITSTYHLYCFFFCPWYSLPFLVYVELYYLYISLFFMRNCCFFKLLFFDIM